MKTLIIYATRFSCTEKCAEKLANPEKMNFATTTLVKKMTLSSS